MVEPAVATEGQVHACRVRCRPRTLTDATESPQLLGTMYREGMVGAVLVVVAGLVFAACGDPPKTADPTATLDLECEQCDVGKVYTAEITISAVAAITLDIDETNDPRGETILEYQIYEGGVFVPEGTETYNAPAGDSFVRFFYKCTRAGTARLRTAAYETGSDYSVAVFEIIKEIVCVPPAPPDIEVRGPNGGVIPSLGADAAGVNPHGVQFTREYTVKNVGTGPLSLMTATFSSQVNCTGAVLVQANPMMLAPGAMGSLTVGVTPTAPGAFECEWDLRNTDPDEDPYSVTVTGTAPSGDIAISAPSSTGPIADGGTQNVAFKPAGVPFTETYRIDNDGLAFLTVGQATIDTLVNCSVSITSQPIATPLPPQTVGATSLVLEITPPAAGAFMCNVSVLSTDPDARRTRTRGRSADRDRARDRRRELPRRIHRRRRRRARRPGVLAELHDREHRQRHADDHGGDADQHDELHARCDDGSSRDHRAGRDDDGHGQRHAVRGLVHLRLRHHEQRCR
ncbi:MAG: hypothetical protein IPQ07_03280 [Myxococcales bacterium]|nr:hypothetical protein [Myxococcales bacterium]